MTELLSLLSYSNETRKQTYIYEVRGWEERGGLFSREAKWSRVNRFIQGWQVVINKCFTQTAVRKAGTHKMIKNMCHFFHFHITQKSISIVKRRHLSGLSVIWRMTHVVKDLLQRISGPGRNQWRRTTFLEITLCDTSLPLHATV